ncbi:MAG: 4'-phosphopantetheinyl transferase superfamily protein [Muribaculaceae bacterium]|nr:4'-phosphopantetheinyl transferase superfamily protein [Muribaculaceae bacterium]
MGDFMYERGIAPCGVAVETIYGADEKSAKVWKLFAMQIFSEAEGDYRAITHLENGAPILEGIPKRISVSHTSHCMMIASLPKTPENNLETVNPRTALGIDIEKADREQVIKIREKFLNEDELKIVVLSSDHDEPTEEEIKNNILAWTCKEALYKAVMGKAPDWKEDYRIISLPAVARNMSHASPDKYGKGIIKTEAGEMEMRLSSWEFEGHIVTLAFSEKIAKYHKASSL